MSSIKDYGKYEISCTDAFEEAWAILKSAKDEYSKSIVDKTYQIIDDILSGVDVEHKYGAHHYGDTDVWGIHIEPKGRTTGDLVLLYRINKNLIEIDLKLHNVTKHDNYYKVSRASYADRQELKPFDLVADKFTPEQLEIAEDCYSEISKDYRVFQLTGEEKENLVDSYIEDYLYAFGDEVGLTEDDFIQMLHHMDNNKNKHIFGSYDFGSDPQQTHPITDEEINHIMGIFYEFDVVVKDAYVENITDEFGDTYIDMYVVAEINDRDTFNELNIELDDLDRLFKLQYKWHRNKYGVYGATYDFYHYFM